MPGLLLETWVLTVEFFRVASWGKTTKSGHVQMFTSRELLSRTDVVNICHGAVWSEGDAGERCPRAGAMRIFFEYRYLHI